MSPGSGAPLNLELADGERPNIVVIMTDDQTVESVSRMPQVNKLLVAEGETFSNSIVTYPLCCPSRASFFTAQYAHNHGVEWNSGAHGGYASFKGQETAVPAALQGSGYRTAHIGKFLNGYGDQKSAAIPKGWNSFQGLAGPSTGQYFQFTINDNGVLRPYGPDQYQTDVLTDLAVDEIKTASAGAAPFFLSLAYLAPHAEFGCPLDTCTAAQIREQREYSNIGYGHSEAVPSPAYKGRYADLPLPDSPSFGAVTEGGSLANDRPELGPVDITDIASGYRSENEALLSVDDGVARLIAALDQAGELDRTFIVFTSDNGFFHGEHRLRYGKYLPYEEALRVPLIIRGPGVAPGSTNSTVVSNVDVSTTLMALTGTEPLREPDGIDVSPLLAPGAVTWDRAVIVEGLGPQSVPQPQYLGIRTRRWAYFEFVQTVDGKGGRSGGRELYNLDSDPYQLKNLSADPQYRDVVDALSVAIANHAQCRGVDCAEILDPAP